MIQTIMPKYLKSLMTVHISQDEITRPGRDLLKARHFNRFNQDDVFVIAGRLTRFDTGRT
jgi:hypothetical protein